jgi:hypothetical protein
LSMNYPIQYRYFAVGLVVGVLLTLLYLSDNFLEAERNGSPLAMAGLAFAIADKGHKDEIFKQGMLSLGYEQVDKRTVSKEYFEVSSVSRKARGLSPTSRAAIMAFFHQARWRASGLRFLVETPPIPSFQLPGLP